MILDIGEETTVTHTTSKIRRTVAGLLVVAVVGLFAMPALAVAQDTGSRDCTSQPTDDQYVTKTVCIQTSTGGGGLSNNVGPLPFTGFDVIAMAAVALAVTGLGLALQRAVVRQSDS
ncbi:hypothetical protein BH10ACT11_BH10ACT11_16320 [soil metagenome]